MPQLMSPKPVSSFSEGILEFFSALKPPERLPEGVACLWPFNQPEVKRIMEIFFTRYFSDRDNRIFLIGINPGRFGAGVTGLCFTDPSRLNEDCGIPHELRGGRELSSDFIYRVINAFGGSETFYRQFYITALSPVGYIRDGKNLNYHDVKGMGEQLDSWMAEALAAQIKAGCHRKIAFSIGQGAHFRYLRGFNERHGFFDRIEPLPHPRWIMQYKRKRLDEFIQLYLDKLLSSLTIG